MTYDVASTVTTVSPAKTGDAREAITVQRMADKARPDSSIASCPDPLCHRASPMAKARRRRGLSSPGSGLMALLSSAPASSAAPPPSSRR